MIPSLAFLLAALALAVVPGPGLAYVVARTVAGGRGEGVASSFGTAAGGMVHVVLSALGLSVVIATSPGLYALIKYLGAAYLLYLGVRILLTRTSPDVAPELAREGAGKAFRDGVVVEALNIKTAMFFIAFIPPFVSPAHPFALQFVILGCLCVAMNTCADLVAVMAASHFLAAGEARASRERVLAGVSGAVMISLGLWLAFSTVRG
ncbi:LysE family translocator [Luteibacter sp. 9135]|uniref:LysE family translocator n=1 Tax=Luteibacter sp. 9135 TaxID=1500893 RepID=UPI000567CE48|nr:LysE family translocator [Luteibacter sp. 9135]